MYNIRIIILSLSEILLPYKKSNHVQGICNQSITAWNITDYKLF